MKFSKVINLAEHLWKYAENFFPEKAEEAGTEKKTGLEGE
jgi:hypothetical protein